MNARGKESKSEAAEMALSAKVNCVVLGRSNVYPGRSSRGGVKTAMSMKFVATMQCTFGLCWRIFERISPVPGVTVPSGVKRSSGWPNHQYLAGGVTLDALTNDKTIGGLFSRRAKSSARKVNAQVGSQTTCQK
jgi:hypothetical protein